MSRWEPDAASDGRVAAGVGVGYRWPEPASADGGAAANVTMWCPPARSQRHKVTLVAGDAGSIRRRWPLVHKRAPPRDTLGRRGNLSTTRWPQVRTFSRLLFDSRRDQPIPHVGSQVVLTAARSARSPDSMRRPSPSSPRPAAAASVGQEDTLRDRHQDPATSIGRPRDRLEPIPPATGADPDGLLRAHMACDRLAVWIRFTVGEWLAKPRDRQSAPARRRRLVRWLVLPTAVIIGAVTHGATIAPSCSASASPRARHPRPEKPSGTAQPWRERQPTPAVRAVVGTPATDGRSSAHTSSWCPHRGGRRRGSPPAVRPSNLPAPAVAVCPDAAARRRGHRK